MTGYSNPTPCCSLARPWSLVRRLQYAHPWLYTPVVLPDGCRAPISGTRLGWRLMQRQSASHRRARRWARRKPSSWLGTPTQPRAAASPAHGLLCVGFSMRTRDCIHPLFSLTSSWLGTPKRSWLGTPQKPCDPSKSAPDLTPLTLTDVFHFVYISYRARLYKSKTDRLAADLETMMLNPNIKSAARRSPGTTIACNPTTFPNQSSVMM